MDAAAEVTRGGDSGCGCCHESHLKVVAPQTALWATPERAFSCAGGGATATAACAAAAFVLKGYHRGLKNSKHNYKKEPSK